MVNNLLMDDSGLSDAAVFDADSLTSLQLCKVTGEGDATTLVVPRCSIRQKYLQDPKKCRRMATNPAAPAVQANGNKSCSPCSAGEWRQILQPLQVSKLEKHLPGLPISTVEDLEEKNRGESLVIKLVEGPQLYV